MFERPECAAMRGVRMHKRGYLRVNPVRRLISNGLRVIALTVVGIACIDIADCSLPEKGSGAKGLRLGLIDQDQLDGQVWSLAFSTDNTHLAWATLAGGVTCKDLTDGRLSRVYNGPIGSVRQVAFAPRRRVLAFAAHEPAIRFWDLDSSAELPALATGGGWTRCLAFSPDGLMLAVGEFMSARACAAVSVWDWTNGRRVALLDDHHEGINALAFSPDGKQLAVGDLSGGVTCWDVAVRKSNAGRAAAGRRAESKRWRFRPMAQ